MANILKMPIATTASTTGLPTTRINEDGMPSPARKVAAAVVGAVVGEISTGTEGGIGRLIIAYSQEATSDPAKVYTAMLGAALLGLVVAGAVSLLELPLMRHRRHVEVVTL